MTDAERVIREHAVQVLAQMIGELALCAAEIRELAVTRATTIGEAEYQGASFRKPPAELMRERFEEYADALFYGCVEAELRSNQLE